MAAKLSDAEISTALEECNNENIRSTALIQPVGCVIAFDRASGTVEAASANTRDMIGLETEALLGKHVRDALSSELEWFHPVGTGEVALPA